MQKKEIFCAAVLLMLTGCTVETLPEQPVLQSAAETENTIQTETAAETDRVVQTETAAVTTAAGLLQTADDICLKETEEQGCYTFLYDGETYSAVYTPDHWKIIDSYRITNSADIILICTALKAAHPIRSADGNSEREASDMAYEWVQHNLAYQLLSESSPYKENAKDVDLDPADQGKSMYEIYSDRCGGQPAPQSAV